MNRRGQTSILLILLATVALVFFAITLNWGRVSQNKTQSTIAATTAATTIASTMASYGQAQVQTLDGSFMKCNNSSLLAVIGEWFAGALLLVVAFFVPPLAPLLINAAIALAISGGFLGITGFVQDAKTIKNFNKMMASQAKEVQFLEEGMSVGLQGVITDQKKITDYFDMNTNGKFGPTSGDMIGRSAFYYSERLKALQKTNIDISTFKNGLIKFEGILTEGCTGTWATGVPGGMGDLHCDICCLPGIYEMKAKRPATTYDEFNTPLNPPFVAGQNDDGSDIIVRNCPNTIAPPAECEPGEPHPFSYDPSYDQYLKKSDPLIPNYDAPAGPKFLAQIGLDAEHRASDGTFKYLDVNDPRKLVVSGIYSMFWDMQHMRNDDMDKNYADYPPSYSSLPNLPSTDGIYFKQNINLTGSPNDKLNPGSLDGRTTDQVQIINGFRTPDGACPVLNDDSLGFGWKKGADQFCSDQWPYDACANTAPDCVADSVDDTIYKLKHFFNEMKDRDILNQEVSHLDEWYSFVGQWVGPKCDGTNALVCQPPNKAGEPGGGALLPFPKRLRYWQWNLAGWLYEDSKAKLLLKYPKMPDNYFRNFKDDGAWCVPSYKDPVVGAPGAPADNKALSPTEIKAINKPAIDAGLSVDEAKEVWGNLNSVMACLDYNSGNQAVFLGCKSLLTINKTPLMQSCVDLGANAPSTPPPVMTTCDRTDFDAWFAAQQAAIDAMDVSPIITNECVGGGTFGCTALPECKNINADLNVPGNASCTITTISTPDQAKLDAQAAAQDRLLKCTEDANRIKYDSDDACTLDLEGTADDPSVCKDMRRSLANYAMPDPRTQPKLYVTWLQDSADLAGSVSYADKDKQAYRFKNRSNFLRKLHDEAKSSLTAVDIERAALVEFMGDPDADPSPIVGAPTANLMDARMQLQAHVESLPNFVIYGWQTPKDVKNPTAGSYWHLVRSEALAPGKCTVPGKVTAANAERYCQGNNIPHIYAGKNGTDECSRMVDSEGTVLTRVTRWDQDHQPTNLNNKSPLWNLHFGNPKSTITPDVIATAIGNLDVCRTWGLLPETKNYIFANGTAQDKESLGNAFMLNAPPDASGITQVCWNAVDRLLSTGVKSTACAQFEGDNQGPPTVIVAGGSPPVIITIPPISHYYKVDMGKAGMCHADEAFEDDRTLRQSP